VVYITEAHARDEWPAGKEWSFCDQPKSLEERQAVARRFVSSTGFKLPVLMDPIDNPFDAAFAAWPFRFYVVQNGKIAFKAQPSKTKYNYEPEQLREWLHTNTA